MGYSKSSKFKVGDKAVPFPTEDGYLSIYLVAGSTYTITKIHKNGQVDVEGTFKCNGGGKNWDSDWFKPYEEKEVKVENAVTAESLRNSILSLQEERVSLQEQIEQNIAQEKALTEQLKELGFLLVESEEQPTNVIDKKNAVLYAEDIEEDMTDSRNWKVGDVITGNMCYSFDGLEVKISKIIYNGEGFECTKNYETDDDFAYFFSADDSKFLYRPVTN